MRWWQLGRWSKGQNKFGLVYSKKALKLKKDLKIRCISHFICLLIIICALHTKVLLKMHSCDVAGGVQNWGKMSHLLQQQGPLLEFFVYTAIFCNDTPLPWTTSSFKSWRRSLEDIKQFCRNCVYSRYNSQPVPQN